MIRIYIRRCYTIKTGVSLLVMALSVLSCEFYVMCGSFGKCCVIVMEKPPHASIKPFFQGEFD